MNSKPRHPWLAALLTLVLGTGLGHMYSGRLQRGILLFVFVEMLLLASALSLTVITPKAFFLFFIVIINIAFLIFCIIDAAISAGRGKKEYRLKKYNRWYAYICFVIVAGLSELCLVGFIIPYISVQAFAMPTGSMEPTLLIGDRILVNKRIYRTSQPNRGDVVAFKHPKNPELAYTKRLIGLPGEKVEMVGHTVYINDTPLEESYTQYIDSGSMYQRYGPYEIPEDQYFVIGDNRDNSQDSRYWGPVPHDHLLGKALAICWSSETPRDAYLINGTIARQVDRLLHFGSRTRWNRIFAAIE